MLTTIIKIILIAILLVFLWGLAVAFIWVKRDEKRFRDSYKKWTEDNEIRINNVSARNAKIVDAEVVEEDD